MHITCGAETGVGTVKSVAGGPAAGQPAICAANATWQTGQFSESCE